MTPPVVAKDKWLRGCVAEWLNLPLFTDRGGHVTHQLAHGTGVILFRLPFAPVRQPVQETASMSKMSVSLMVEEYSISQRE